MICRPPVSDHYVSPYYRQDGIYVKGHYQTKPDGSFWNNYSSSGTLNPNHRPFWEKGSRSTLQFWKRLLFILVRQFVRIIIAPAV